VPFAHLKVSLEFRMPGDGGWTEQYYRAGAAIDSGAVAACNQLIQKRLLPLVPVASIKGFRVSAVEQRRVSQHFRIRAGQGAPGGFRDLASAAVLVTCFAGAGHQRQVHILGCTDARLSWDVNGQEESPVSPGITAFLDYLTLPANGWGMRVETLVAGDPALTPVTDISVTGNKVSFSAAGLTINPRQKFLISGLKGFKVSQFAGQWKALSYAAGILQTFSNRRIDPNFVLEEPAQIRVINDTFYTYPTFTGYDADGMIGSTRKVGREPGLSRGRRSKAS